MASRELSSDSAHLRKNPAVSVILTVVNESRHLKDAVDSILRSDFDGDLEIVIAVGPSRDGTRELAEQISRSEPRIRVIENPSGRTPDGLNAALKESSHEIVVRMDGHSEIAPGYISLAVQILEKTKAVNVGGIMAAEGTTPFESAVATAMRSPLGVGSSRFHTGGESGSVDTVYLGVFRRSALLAIGGYDQRFTRAQDWEMNYRLRKAGGVVWFDPRLQVKYRPRNSIAALARQYFEYGRWRRAVLRRHQGSVHWRYLAPPINLFINFLSIVGGLFLSPLLLIPTLIYLAAILTGSLIIGKNWNSRFILPVVLITMHFSWGFGFISSPRRLLSE